MESKVDKKRAIGNAFGGIRAISGVLVGLAKSILLFSAMGEEPINLPPLNLNVAHFADTFISSRSWEFENRLFVVITIQRHIHASQFPCFMCFQ